MYDLKIQDAMDEGIAIGIEQGMERGKKRWLQQGIEQERNKIISILDYDNIGLSDEQKKIIIAEFSRSADKKRPS